VVNLETPTPEGSHCLSGCLMLTVNEADENPSIAEYSEYGQILNDAERTLRPARS
jgi:hypothetical protein